MLVRLAKGIVRQWVVEKASQIPGFQGAFFHGSINWLAEEEFLPATSDVDVMIVIEGAAPLEKLGKFAYQGVIIEASYLPEAQIQSAEQVLGVSHLAGSLRENSLIADPTRHLRDIQAVVASDYAKRKWVERRCAHAHQKVLAHLQDLNETEQLHNQVNHWLFGAGVTTHILLAAGLKNPTVRKRYLATRELLAEYNQSAFYATLLALLGCAEMSQERAKTHLDTLAQAFDAAKTVIRTQFAFAADISDLARPVAIDGSREMIGRGDQREAVFWMAVTFSRCHQVLSHDAGPELQEHCATGFRALLADLGIHSFADQQDRSRQVRETLPQVWQVAETIMDLNREIS